MQQIQDFVQASAEPSLAVVVGIFGLLTLVTLVSLLVTGAR